MLTGNSGYSGTATIHAGKLQVGDAGTTGTLGSGNIVNNSTLVFARTDAITVNNVISGTGELSFNFGTTTVNGANSYSGGTFLSSGTVNVGNASALGTGYIAVQAGATLDLNGIAMTGAGTGALFTRIAGLFPGAESHGVISNTSATQVALVANNAADEVFDGQLQLNILFEKQGANTLYFTDLNANDGPTVISGGTLALLGAGAAFSQVLIGSAGTFNISGISGAATTVRDVTDNILVPGAGGKVILGGKTLIVDTAFSFFNEAAAPSFTGTAGLSDGLVVKLEASISSPVNLSLPKYQFLNWEDGFDTITIMGNNNNDVITGSKFSDSIFGSRDGLGTGDDSLDGGAGDDVLSGGNGNDKLTGGTGDDTLDGGANIDTASYEFAPTSANGIGVTVSLLLQGVAQNTKFMGLDTLIGIENLTGSKNADTLTGDAGVNILNGKTGNDVLEGGAGGDTLDSGGGIDTLSYASSNAGVTVNITANTASGGHATGDTIIAGFDNIIGSNFNDILTGTSLANVIMGRDGVDNISSVAGNDTLNGGGGNDFLRGGAGIDNLTGGLGNDTFSYSALNEGDDIVTDFHNVVGDNDIFRFLGSAFGGLAPGALAANRFEANVSGAATTVDARFIYETDTGQLRYDADGNLGGAAVLIASISAAPVLTLADFIII